MIYLKNNNILCVYIWWNLHIINNAGGNVELFLPSTNCVLMSFEFIKPIITLSHL